MAAKGSGPSRRDHKPAKRSKATRPRRGRTPARPRAALLAGAMLPGDVAAPPLLDRRLIERQMATIHRILDEREFSSAEEANAFLQDLLQSGGGKLPDLPAETPLERAQEIIYQAVEATGRRRVQLAHRALEISPDCADAYVLLGDAASDPREARRLYEEGVRAGERALGPEMFEEARGEFWGVLETRPYMRARENLAQVLWFQGERAAAIDHLRAMLELNPNDNQGVRYYLARWLLEVGDDAALDALLTRYREDASAEWSYGRALLAFRRHGAGRRADAALRRALEANPFVPAYLLGVERLPKKLPEYIGLGDQNEAIAYVAESAELWAQTEGALEWFIAVFMREAAKLVDSEPPPPRTRRRGGMRLLTPDDALDDAPEA